MGKTAPKLWNKNFFLLWQGQLVSVLGDALYTMALNFFVLELTGSVALMGTIMALVTIPRVLCGPVAGAVVDRVDRRLLIVGGDLLRGAAVLLLALAAWRDVLQVWMILVVAVLCGVCASFFNPAIESVLPDIVPARGLTRANAVYQMATTGADVLGQSVGGGLYTLLGGPVIFLCNGLSYLFSALTEGFLEVPRVQHRRERASFWDDFQDGFRFLMGEQGLIRVIGFSFVLNFLFGMVRVLVIPWFVGDPQLGMTRYGILSAAQSLGLICGMIVLSLVSIPPRQSCRVYRLSLFLFIGLIGAGAAVGRFWMILSCFFLAFGFQFVFNTVVNSAVMLKTPADLRGKVLATKTTLGMAVSPFGNFAGGVLCTLLPPRALILVSSVLGMAVAALAVLHPSVQEFLEGQTGVAER